MVTLIGKHKLLFFDGNYFQTWQCLHEYSLAWGLSVALPYMAGLTELGRSFAINVFKVVFAKAN